MWISSIKLKNFKSYAEAHFQFPEPKDGKNLVIIGAKNGHGKTTLLEAIYLGLYDEDAISHLDRAGLSEKRSYPDYLQHALHHQAQTRYGQQYCIDIEIDLLKRNVQGKLEGIRVKRQWFFDHKRELMRNNRLMIISQLVDEGSSALIAMPLEDGQASAYFATHALPIDYAPFFFFDGEKIVSSARSTGAGVWLAKALRGLLGVTLLEQLGESLQSYRNQHVKAGSSAKIQEQIDKAEKDMATVRAKLQIAEEILEQELQTKEQLSLKIDELTTQLGSMTNGSIQTSEELVNAINQAEQTAQHLQSSIQSAFENLPLALLPRPQIKQLLHKLEQEKNRLEHEAGKDQIEGKVDDFWYQFSKNQKVKEALGIMAEPILQHHLMKDAVRECWELLYYPLPENCANQITHNYLSQTAHANIQSEYRSLGKINTQSISQVMDDLQKSEHEQEQLRNQLNDMKGNGTDKLVEELKQKQKSYAESSQKVGVCENNKLNVGREYQRVHQELQRLIDQNSDNTPRQQKANRSKQVQDMIEELTKALMKLKTDEVAQVATFLNQKIAHDHRIDKIKIDEQGKMQLFGKNGLETNVDLSAGQIQVLMIALISAMAEVTDYQMPFVIDTPLARLDSEHRQGIFEHWTSLDQQVILLAQDTEVNADVAEYLASAVNKTYLVEATSLDSSGAVSHITANAYFQ